MIGAIVQVLGAPLLFGSLGALNPGMLAALLLVVRTMLEDEALQVEVDSYEEYARQAQFRPVSGSGNHWGRRYARECSGAHGKARRDHLGYGV